MASSAMSSATPRRDISVRAVRRRSCRRKATPLARCSLAVSLVQPLSRPPVFDDGNTSGEVVNLAHQRCERHLVLGAGLGVLRHDDDAIGAEVVALEGGELAAACPGEER